MYKKAKQHFKTADPKLYAVALEIELTEVVPSKDLYRDILWTIVGQQLSARAADAIFERFQKVLPKGSMTPEVVLAQRYETLRGAGLSGAKARAVHAFSDAVRSGDVSLSTLRGMPDEEVMAHLTKVKGIGPWTAEMILMFSLARPDVFSRGDLGLRKGMMQLYGMRNPPSEKRLRQILNRWSPYRTYAARILWRLSDRKTARKGRKRPA